jgi:hypothetical protein
MAESSNLSRFSTLDHCLGVFLPDLSFVRFLCPLARPLALLFMQRWSLCFDRLPPLSISSLRRTQVAAIGFIPLAKVEKDLIAESPMEKVRVMPPIAKESDNIFQNLSSDCQT